MQYVFCLDNNMASVTCLYNRYITNFWQTKCTHLEVEKVLQIATGPYIG